MKKLLLLSTVSLFCIIQTQAQQIMQGYWETNGKVNTAIRHNNKLYIGGEFTYAGPTTSGTGQFVLGPTQTLTSAYTIEGTVNASVTDASGNLYLGGDFSVNGGSRRKLAKFTGATSFDPTFNFNFDGAITSMAINNNCLFVAGTYGMVNGQFRNGLAGIELATNLLSTFAPNPDGAVNALSASNDVLYVGGSFSSISATSRASLAAYNGSKTLLPLNANIRGRVTAIGAIDSLLFFGGVFDSVNSVSRVNLASINLSTGNLRSWKADVVGAINDIDFGNNNVYLAGNFYQVGVESRTHLAAINTVTGLVQSFNPGLDNEVLSICVKGNNLYAGGHFQSVGNDTKSFLAGIGLNSGTVTGNLPAINGSVNTLTNRGDTLIFAGDFSSFGGKLVSNFAVLDWNSGVPLNYSMNVDGPIYDLEMVGNDLLVAGDFVFVNQDLRSGVAIVDTALFIPTAWDIHANGAVKDALVFGNTIYLAGEFTSFGTTERNYLGLVNALSGVVASWNPNLDKRANKLLLNQTQLYAIGDFTSIGAASRKNIASFDIGNNGALRNWAIIADSSITSLSTDGNTLFVGGLFKNIGTSSRNGLAALDTGTAALKVFSPALNGDVYSIKETGGLLFVGGNFNTNLANSFTCFNAINGNEVDFPAKLASGDVGTIVQIENKLIVSGNFNLANAGGKRNLAAIDMNVSLPSVQANSATVSTITPTSIRLHFNKGNGLNQIVLARMGAAVDSMPFNGMNYLSNAEFGLGNNIGSNFIVYNGTDTTVNITGLNTGTSYHFAVFTYNGFSAFTNYLQTNPARTNATTLTGYSPPSTAASNITFSNIRLTQMTVKWTKGNGTGRYVVAKEASAVTQIPKDSIAYNSGSEFGTGDMLTGNQYIVYSGTMDSVVVTGLKSGTAYYYSVYEYNGESQFRRVLSSAPSGNASTLTLASEPTTAASSLTFSNVTSDSMQIGWTNGNGAGRVVIASMGQPVSSTLNDGETYFTDNSFNGNSSYLSANERVVYVGTGNSFTLSGLDPVTNYHFQVVDYNGSNFTTNYKASGNPIGSQTTKSNLNFPTIAAKDIQFTKIGRDTLQFNWTSGNGAMRLAVIRKDNAVTGLPMIGKTYKTDSKYGMGDSLDDGSFVVFNGTGNSATVVGLSPKTTYYVSVFEQNSSGIGPIYLTDSVPSASVQTLPPTGLDKLKRTGGIKTFPNPVVEGKLYITIEQPSEKDMLALVFDMQGKLVLETKPEMLNTREFSIETNNLPIGDYILKITGSGTAYQSRFRIQ